MTQRRALDSDVLAATGRVYGSYELKEVLGEGGMGVVYLAEHQRLGHRVALKQLKARHASNRKAVKRFVDEAWAIGQIHHPNIVKVTDFVLNDEIVYYIMELLEGRTLGAVLEAERVLSPGRSLALACQVAEALAAVHKKGFVHGDIKPSNVYLATQDDSELVKLLDFGLATLVSDGKARRRGTSQSSQLVTPVYMSPEQGEQLPLDGRSDVYSFGAVLYQMLTGRPPFKAVTFAEYIYKHSQVPAVPVAKAARSVQRVPRGLARIVDRCLAKKPVDRFPSAVELRDALHALRSGAASWVDCLEVEPVTRLGRRWILVAGLAVVGLVLGVIAWPRESRRTEADPTRARATPAVGRDAAMTGTGTPSATLAMIDLRIESRPTRAVVERISPTPAILGVTPLVLRLPVQEATWKVQVWRTGYQARLLEIPLRTDYRWRVVLEPISTAPTGPIPPPRPRVMRGPRAPRDRPLPPPRTVDPMGVLDPFMR